MLCIQKKILFSCRKIEENVFHYLTEHLCPGCCKRITRSKKNQFLRVKPKTLYRCRTFPSERHRKLEMAQEDEAFALSGFIKFWYQLDQHLELLQRVGSGGLNPNLKLGQLCQGYFFTFAKETGKCQYKTTNEIDLIKGWRPCVLKYQV